MSDDSGNGVAMLLLVLAVVAVIGIFAYFMASNSKGPSTVIQTPAPQQISIPTPAKPGAQ